MSSTPAANQARFVFKAGDRPLSVVRFSAREALSQIYQVKLDLVSRKAVRFAQVMGQPGLLTIESGQEDRFFHGLVIAFASQSGQGTRTGWHHYQAELQPQAALLVSPVPQRAQLAVGEVIGDAARSVEGQRIGDALIDRRA